MKILFQFLCICTLTVVHGQELKQLPVENGILNYLSLGQGETIVFIHGTQEDYTTFIPAMKFLQDSSRVVSYSRRYNFPNQNEITNGFGVQSETDDLLAMINKLGEKVHLVGHSYGGQIALNFAVQHPKLLKSLTLSEPALITWLKDIPGCESYYGKVQKELLEETREAFKTKDTTLILKELFEFFTGRDMQDEVPEEFLNSLKINLREVEALVDSRDPFSAPNPETLRSLKMPVMILTTENTMPMLKCTNTKLAETLPESIHHHLDDAGHELWLTHPEQLASYLYDFIQQQ